MISPDEAISMNLQVIIIGTEESSYVSERDTIPFDDGKLSF